VTFLFVIMLAQQAGLSSADARSREPLLATLTGFLLLGALLYVLQMSYVRPDIDGLVAETREARAKLEALRDEVRTWGTRVPDDEKKRRMDRGIAAIVGDSKDRNYLFIRYAEVLRANGFGDMGEAISWVEFFKPPAPDTNAVEQMLAKVNDLETLALQ